MPYDPRKLKEDRTPPPPKPAPRGIPGGSIMAWRDGHCIQCGKPYGEGERIVVNQAMPSGLMSESDGYHLECWKAIAGVSREG
jgi:hypothetical protein